MITKSKNMAKGEFVFKKEWFAKAHQRLPLHCIGYFVILVVEYGLYGKHEEILDYQYHEIYYTV